jgi:hypothetical protein
MDTLFSSAFEDKVNVEIETLITVNVAVTCKRKSSLTQQMQQSIASLPVKPRAHCI